MFLLPRVMSHRCAAALAPENTLAGLRAAAASGVTWIEFDVMLTKDRIPVLFHDDKLKRTTGQDALMAETTYGELAKLEAGSWFAPEFAGEAVPSLESALALVRELGLSLNLEIKPTKSRDVETAAVALETLRRSWSPKRPGTRSAILVSSFSPACLEVAQSQAPEFPRALNAFRLPRGWARQAARLDCVSVHLSDWRLSARTVARIKAAGYGVAAFTVNAPHRARKLVARGVDCIMTDSPKLIMDALG